MGHKSGNYAVLLRLVGNLELLADLAQQAVNYRTKTGAFGKINLWIRNGLGKVNGVKLRQRGENKVKTPCAKPVKQLSGDACIECKTDIFSGYCFRNRSASPRTKSFPRVQRSPRRISPSPRPHAEGRPLHCPVS